MARSRGTTPLGTSQFPWKRPVTLKTGLCTASATAPTAGAYAHSVTKPATTFTAATPTAGVFWLEGEPANEIALKFFGSGSATGTFSASIYSVSPSYSDPVPPDSSEYKEWYGSYIGQFTVTLGATAGSTSSTQLPSPILWADTITVNVDKIRNGWKVFADTAASVAVVQGDMDGSTGIVVVLTTAGGSATGMGFMWREI